MPGGRPARNEELERPRTKAWYFCVRREIAHILGKDEELLKPDDIHRYINQRIEEQANYRLELEIESKIWHKYSLGINSPVNIKSHKSKDGKNLKTYELVDLFLPGTAKIYINGPQNLWDINKAWSIKDAFYILDNIFDKIPDKKLTPLRDIANLNSLSESECWLSQAQHHIFWKSNQVSISSIHYPELSMHALSFGLACLKFCGFYDSLQRVLSEQPCTNWINKFYGIDVIDFAFHEDLINIPAVIRARANSGYEDDIKIGLL